MLPPPSPPLGSVCPASHTPTVLFYEHHNHKNETRRRCKKARRPQWTATTKKAIPLNANSTLRRPSSCKAAGAVKQQKRNLSFSHRHEPRHFSSEPRTVRQPQPKYSPPETPSKCKKEKVETLQGSMDRTGDGDGDGGRVEIRVGR